MTDRPIIFSGPMVNALLAGRKTMTRRVLQGLAGIARDSRWNAVKGDDGVWRFVADTPDEGGNFPCGERFAVGDRLWVREAWRAPVQHDGSPPRDLPIGCGRMYEADGLTAFGLGAENLNPIGPQGRLRPSIFLPRWANRLTLTVAAVKIERLQDISEEDAIAEGVQRLDGQFEGCFVVPGAAAMSGVSARDCFRSLWNGLHGSDAWAADPWVVAPNFTVEHRNIDAPAKPVREATHA